jgi:hypothetical protein
MAENPKLPETQRHNKTMKRNVWQRPVLRHLGMDEAETGINSGPEVLVLLS